MEHRGLVKSRFSRVLDHERAGRERRGNVHIRKRARRNATRAGLRGPDRREVAFARAFRSDQGHDPVRPVGLTVDQPQRRGVRWPAEEVVAGVALRMIEVQGELPKASSIIHAGPALVPFI